MARGHEVRGLILACLPSFRMRALVSALVSMIKWIRHTWPIFVEWSEVVTVVISVSRTSVQVPTLGYFSWKDTVPIVT